MRLIKQVNNVEEKYPWIISNLVSPWPWVNGTKVLSGRQRNKTGLKAY